MELVGISELKNNLSRFVRRVVDDKAVITVTEHGHVVAVLGPPELAHPKPWRDLTVAERVLLLGGSLPTATGPMPNLPRAPAGEAPVDVAALLDELRGDR